MTTNPLVSVVLGTYNRADIVCRSLDSLIAQTYRPIEVIVVNDASTDQTGQVLHDYANRHGEVRVIHLPKNLGPGGARNTGIREAKSNYVAIMDDDDLCVETRLAKQVEVLETHGDIDLCFGLVEWIDESGESTGIFPGLLAHNRFPESPEDVFSLLLLESNKIPDVTLMARRDVLIDHPYPENVRIGEDWSMVLAMAAGGVRMRGIPEVLVYQSRYAGRQGLMQNKREAFRSQRTVLKDITKRCGVSRSLTRQAYSSQLTREARYWGRWHGLWLNLRALVLWPDNGEAKATLRELVTRGIQKTGLKI
jgi:teichuronic acid biosynthesis glycosyltransferase TuaG